MLEDLIGLVEKRYTKLARYCHNMERTNDDSTFFIETNGKNHFKYFSWNLDNVFGDFVI